MSDPATVDVTVIRFTASVAQVRTMADGGLRVMLDFDESAIGAATALMQVKQGCGVLEIAAVPVITAPAVKEDSNDKPRKRYSPYAKTKAEAT